MSEPLEKRRKIPMSSTPPSVEPYWGVMQAEDGIPVDEHDNKDTMQFKVERISSMDMEQATSYSQICIAERAKLICEHLQATVDKPLLESLNEITKRLDGAKEYLSLVPPSLTQLQLNHYQLQAWIVCESLMLSTATNLLLEQKSKVDGMQERGTSFVTKYISSNRRCRELESRNAELEKQVLELKAANNTSESEPRNLTPELAESSLAEPEAHQPNLDTPAPKTPPGAPADGTQKNDSSNKKPSRSYRSRSTSRGPPPQLTPSRTSSWTVRPMHAGERHPEPSKVSTSTLLEHSLRTLDSERYDSQFPTLKRTSEMSRQWRSSSVGREDSASRYCPPGSSVPFGPDFAPCGPVFVPCGQRGLVCIGPGFTPSRSCAQRIVPVSHGFKITSSAPRAHGQLKPGVSTPGFGHYPKYLPRY